MKYIQGHKVLSRNTLKCHTKDELIEFIRELEFAYEQELATNDVQYQRLQNMFNYLENTGLSSTEILKIISIEGEER